jgi:hypothetical protein
MLSKMVSGHTCADKTSNGIFLIGRAKIGWTRRGNTRGAQRGETREFVR